MFECLMTLAGLIWPIFSVTHHMPFKNTNDTVNTGDRERSRKTNSAEDKRSQLKMFYKACLYKLRDTYQGVYSDQLLYTKINGDIPI